MTVRTDAKLTQIEDVKGRKRLKFAAGADLTADVVIMATGIRTNLDWLKGSGVDIKQGIVVDEHLRSSIPNVYAAGDVAEGRDLISGQSAVHAIEPTAQEHGRDRRRQHGRQGRALPRLAHHQHRRGLSSRRRLVRRLGRRARPRRSAA